eukprot:scaffold2193_cov179-Ochromonas_danica.AAC.9
MLRTLPHKTLLDRSHERPVDESGCCSPWSLRVILSRMCGLTNRPYSPNLAVFLFSTIAVIANQFIIREVKRDHPDFLYSANLWDVAQRKGFWHPEQGPLDFLLTYAPPRAHSPYATRRVWRVFQLAAPSISLPADTDPLALNYPFSVKVDKPLAVEDIIQMNRDHYEGTQFDLTKGLAAGPYGDPNRFDMAAVDNKTYLEILQGSYERSISLFRTSYSFVSQARPTRPDQLALLWFSQYAPSASSYAPFYVASNHVPKPYMKGSLFKYDSSVSFWNFLAAGNYAARFYRFAMEDVQAVQNSLHQSCKDLIQRVENEVLAGATGAGAVALLTEATDKAANTIVSAWRDLLPQLITKYHDGYVAQTLDAPHITMKKLFYPLWWLQMTGYFENHVNSGPDVILFSPPAPGISTGSQQTVALLTTAIVSVLLTLSAVWLYQQSNRKRIHYVTLGDENL